MLGNIPCSYGTGTDNPPEAHTRTANMPMQRRRAAAAVGSRPASHEKNRRLTGSEALAGRFMQETARLVLEQRQLLVLLTSTSRTIPDCRPPLAAGRPPGPRQNVTYRHGVHQRGPGSAGGPMDDGSDSEPMGPSVLRPVPP